MADGRTPRLPAMPGDPAGGGRVRPSPRTRGLARTADANPFIPDMEPHSRKQSSEGRGAMVVSPGGSRSAFNTSMASVVSIRTGSADSFYPSASGASPRQTSEAKCKRLERLHDLYQTSFSRETLLSEQYSKELLQMREQLREVLSSGQAGTHAVKGRDEGAKRTQARETKRIETMETKLSGLEVYNGQLISAINNLRMLNAPNRQAIRKLAADRQKLAEGVTRHKNNTAKSLDERERFIDQLRKGRDESAYEKANFMEQVPPTPGHPTPPHTPPCRAPCASCPPLPGCPPAHPPPPALLPTPIPLETTLAAGMPASHHV